MSPVDAPLASRRVPTIIVAVTAVAALYAWAVFALTPTHPGSIGLNLNALGTDWMVFYSGPHWFFAGQLDALYDGDRFTAYLNSTFADWLSQPTPYRPWVYPPSYLLAMLPFGALPFATSYVAFQFVTAALLAIALCSRPGDPNSGYPNPTYPNSRPPSPRALIVGAALLGPAAAINAGMGQNGFLTAALLVGGFRLLQTRPALGGAGLGLLTMKPQFWLLVPVALVASREWRALAWSLAAGMGLALASAAVFGLDSWRHWIDLARGSYADPHDQWIEFGRLWGDSVYACLVAGGASAHIADAAQAAATLGGIILAYRAFRFDLPRDCRIAVLLAATMLAAPHSSLADTVLLGTAAALWSGELVRTGASLTQWTLALALWIVPLVNPPLISPIGRFTPLLVPIFIGVVMFRPERAPSLPGAPLLHCPVRLAPRD